VSKAKPKGAIRGMPPMPSVPPVMPSHSRNNTWPMMPRASVASARKYPESRRIGQPTSAAMLLLKTMPAAMPTGLGSPFCTQNQAAQ
jgi:hypothetical protein